MVNINEVYLCDIYRIISYDISKENVCVNYKYKFLKRALVHVDYLGNFINLETNRRYITGSHIGDLFIDNIIPISEIINSKRINMSKGRILKKYKEVENGGRKE